MDPLICQLCKKEYSNKKDLSKHKNSSVHRYNKEIYNLKNTIKTLEERNKELEKIVDESTDAIFMYEMKLAKYANAEKTIQQ